jgi:hypothetical protein
MLISDLYKWHPSWVIRHKFEDGSVAWFTKVFRRATYHRDGYNPEFGPYTVVRYEYKSFNEISDLLNTDS